MKDAKGHDQQSKRNREAYQRRKREGYYANKIATKTKVERDAEAEAKRSAPHVTPMVQHRARPTPN